MNPKIDEVRQLAKAVQRVAVESHQRKRLVVRTCSFEAILVDLQRPDLRFQRGSWYPKLGSGAGGSVHPSSAFAQRSLNDCFLLRGRLLKEARLRVQRCCRRLSRKPTLID